MVFPAAACQDEQQVNAEKSTNPVSTIALSKRFFGGPVAHIT